MWHGSVAGAVELFSHRHILSLANTRDTKTNLSVVDSDGVEGEKTDTCAHQKLIFQS
jgi:hypothetical protein